MVALNGFGVSPSAFHPPASREATTAAEGVVLYGAPVQADPTKLPLDPGVEASWPVRPPPAHAVDLLPLPAFDSASNPKGLVPAYSVLLSALPIHTPHGDPEHSQDQDQGIWGKTLQRRVQSTGVGALALSYCRWRLERNRASLIGLFETLWDIASQVRGAVPST